jgi:hypothetical protein
VGRDWQKEGGQKDGETEEALNDEHSRLSVNSEIAAHGMHGIHRT